MRRPVATTATARRALRTADFVTSCVVAHAHALEHVKALLQKKDPVLLAKATRTQLDFWSACYLIPRGYVTTYRVLSQIVEAVRCESSNATGACADSSDGVLRSGKTRLSRVAGRCMSANPLLKVIPCHRVVSTLRHELTGYRGDGVGAPHATRNLAIKAELLEAEGVPVVVVPHSDGGRWCVSPECRHVLD